MKQWEFGFISLLVSPDFRAGLSDPSESAGASEVVLPVISVRQAGQLLSIARTRKSMSWYRRSQGEGTGSRTARQEEGGGEGGRTRE